jgi:hypothetical protein
MPTPSAPGIAVPPLASPRLLPGAPPSHRILGTLALCTVRILCPQSVPSHVPFMSRMSSPSATTVPAVHIVPRPPLRCAPPPARNPDCVPCAHPLYGAIVRCLSFPCTCVRSAAARPCPRTRPPCSAMHAVLHPLLLRCTLPALATCVWRLVAHRCTLCAHLYPISL